ncbi:VanZ like family protein [compost metagenome]
MAQLHSVLRLALISVPAILVLEVLQMLLRVGSFDIDDLLLNLQVCGRATDCF